MSLASSHTLSTCDEKSPDASALPVELLQKIIGSAIGGHVHDWLSFAVTSRYTPLSTFDRGFFRSFWQPISHFMAVSLTFRALVIYVICLAFGVRPLETKSLSRQVYEKLRSLFYFSRAIHRGALMDPPPALCPPFLKGYCCFVVIQRQPLHGTSQRLSVSRLEDLMQDLESSDGLPRELIGYLLDDMGQLVSEQQTSSVEADGEIKIGAGNEMCIQINVVQIACLY